MTETTHSGAVKKKGAPPPVPTVIEEGALVAVRITKAGHGLVFSGVESETYDWNDEVVLEGPTAKALEDRHFVEIL
jgi:hypothetical protein